MAAGDIKKRKIEDISSTIMWVEKYRPKSLEKVISNQSNIRSVKKLIDGQKLPNLLLYGPPGTGKTSTALIIAKLMNKDNTSRMTLELNASDTRGIDTVRNEIKVFAQTAMLFQSEKPSTKLIILDESDSMTKTAQFALRQIIEEYSRHVRFCFICNRIGNIIPAIQSRCVKMRFGYLQQEDIQNLLKFIADNENISFTIKGLQSIAILSNGDMRNAINILQSCYFGHGDVTEKNVHKATGLPTVKEIDAIYFDLLKESAQFCFERIKSFQSEKGIALSELITRLFDCCLNNNGKKILSPAFYEEISQIENRVLKGATEDIQIAALIAVFKLTFRNK